MTILTLARLTVLDLVRRRLFVILVLFGAGLILLSFPLRDLTIGQWRRLITDIGLGATDLSLTLVAILVGATLIAGDLDRKTLYPLLARPLSRSTFVVGKFVGLAALLLGLCVVMLLGTDILLLLAKEPGFVMPLLQNGVTIALSAILMGAISLCFSCFTSATVAGITALGLMVAGHLTGNLAYFGTKAPSALARWLLTGLSKALPNLEALNLKDFAAHTQPVSAHDLGIRLAYGACYAAAAVALGALAFTRRDLK